MQHQHIQRETIEETRRRHMPDALARCAKASPFIREADTREMAKALAALEADRERAHAGRERSQFERDYRAAQVIL